MNGADKYFVRKVREYVAGHINADSDEIYFALLRPVRQETGMCFEYAHAHLLRAIKSVLG